MTLVNLNKMALEAKNSFDKFQNEDILLSSEFKREFANFIETESNELITYSTYSAVIITSSGLTITFPNQWFYIACYFVPFLRELRKYKEGFNYVFHGIFETKEIIKQIKESKTVPLDLVGKINDLYKNESDSLYFQKFLSDYEWWFGSKTIDRSDFYVSPILNLAKVVNASQSYIADLTYYLSERENLLVALKNSVNKLDYNPKVFDEIIKEENSIRDFALYVFNYFYGANWIGLINKCEKKPSKINDKDFQSYDLDVFNRLIASFDESQSKEDLTSGKTQRYFEEPILIFDSIYYYFTTQWNGAGEYSLNFNNLKSFFEEKFPRFQLIKTGKKYSLLKESGNTELKFDFTVFGKHTNAAGLLLSTQLIQRFIASLLTKPFVILTGLSGSGKTKLAQAFVYWICQNKSQYCIVPVGADWTNREPLLGYPNALKPEEYVKPDNGVLDLIFNAIKTPDQPHFLILDEMNLSHVERYFADFLSAMESQEEISLHANLPVQNGVPARLKLPPNLFIIGTVNIHETTNMFSPKVLDRANTIEFRVTRKEMANFLNHIKDLKMESLEKMGASMAKSFMDFARNKSFSNSDNESINSTLILFFGELKKSGAEFGYRSATEMLRLIHQLSVLDSELKPNQKLDIAIMQKLLPKLHGSRRKLCPVLETLGSFCLSADLKIIKDVFDKPDFNFDSPDVKYPLSLEKISRMYRGAIDNGFASFAEA